MLLGKKISIWGKPVGKTKGLLSQLKYMMLAKKLIPSITDLSLLPKHDYLRSMDMT